MVKLKYSALYTDNIGCEQAEVYFSENGFELKVRNCIFEDNDFNFDFCAKNHDKIKHLFYLKDDELIEYFIDIKIPIILTYNNKEIIKEFLLSVKRDKNYYKNSLSFKLNGERYEVEGHNLNELLKKMKANLPKEYSLESDLSSLMKVFFVDSSRVTSYNNTLKCLYDEEDIILDKKTNLNLFNIENKNKYEKFERILVMYVYNKYCLS